MKAPDKIYMPNELLTEEWQLHIEGEDTAYIRKDALLEWVKERLDFACALKSEGQKTVCKELIDKLNSM